jgi:hypothetical protein
MPRLAVRITPTLFLLLCSFAVGGALVAAPRGAGAAGCNGSTTTTTTLIPCASATTPECNGSCATGKMCVEVLGRGCQCVSSTTPTCEIGLCVAEGDLCEPCLPSTPRGPSAGSCAKTVEGDLRCQVFGCEAPNNCTSSAQCRGDQFCGLFGGGPSGSPNACCPLCLPVLEVPIICSSQGDQCGKLVSEDGRRWCRTGPGFYFEGFCATTTEGDLRCQAVGCLDTTCTSSGQCGSGFFCGRDAGGSGVNLCCPLCQ